MKYIILILLLLSSRFVVGQNTHNTTDQLGKQLLIEEKIRTLENEVNRLQNEIISNERASQTTIADTKNELNKHLDNNKDDTQNLINLYVFFITVGFILIGFGINFFGKSA